MRRTDRDDLRRAGPPRRSPGRAVRLLPPVAYAVPAVVRALPALVRVARHRGRDGLRAALWAGWAWHRVRHQLARGALDGVRLPAPPQDCGPEPDLVLGVLRRVGASCLERSLVLQRWYAGQQIVRTLVIGVNSPSSGFRAHAWLDGEPDPGRHGLVEVLHRPPPPEWFTEPDQAG